MLAFNAPGAPDAARQIGQALARASAGARAHPAAALQRLAGQLGLPRGLRDIGFGEEQIAEAAQLIEPAVPADNPVPADAAAALLTLLRQRADAAGDL